MPQFQITAPDGRKFVVSGPEGSTREQALEKIKAQYQQKPQEPQEAKPQVNNTVAGGRKALQGATFGLGDEIQAAIAAPIAKLFQPKSSVNLDELRSRGFKAEGPQSLADLYKQGRNELRTEDKAFTEANPKTALALELAGGLSTGGIGAAKMGAAKSLPALAKFGAGTGGIAGLGYSEADSLLGDLGNTATGAAIGTGLGLAAKPTGALLNKAGERLSPIASRMFPNAEDKAKAQILKELKRAGLSPEEAADHLKRNPNLVLGDLSENLRQRTASVATLPGKASEKADELLTTRNRSQLDRVVPEIRKGLGEDARYLDAVSELQSSMKTRAAPLYDEAYKTFIEPTQKMRQLVDVIPKEAFKKAEKLAKTEFVELDFDNLYDTRTLDYVMRGLSDIEGKNIRGGATQFARSLGNVRRELSNEIYEQNPAFREARKVWSGGKADEEAIEIGRKALRQDSESLRSQVKNMSESELKHFRIGVMKAIEDSVEGMSVNRDLVKKFRDVPKINKALRTAFRDEDSYKGFMKFLDDEASMVDTYTKAKTGSRTTPLSESNDELKKGFFTTAVKALLTSGGSLKYDAATAGTNRLFKPIESKNEVVRNMMGDMFLENDPKKLLSSLLGPSATNQKYQSLVEQLTNNQMFPGSMIGGGQVLINR